jgi:hypothetical protein
VRIILAVISAWILQGLFGDGRVVIAMSFLAGFVPNTILRLVREVAEKGVGLRRARRRARSDHPDDDFAEDTPLTVLDGMDIYERTRLEEEGITGVQALSRHDLIDLILSSRIPVPRLIDWLDQALLYQHAADDIKILRKRGIRTATDFLQVYADEEALRALGAGKDGPAIAPVLLATALDDDEWLAYVKHWRAYDVVAPPRVRRYGQDGRLVLEPPDEPDVPLSAGPPAPQAPGPFAGDVPEEERPAA